MRAYEHWPFEGGADHVIAEVKEEGQIKRLVVWLGLSTYRAEVEPEVGVRVVVGKMSSSHWLHLDPAGIGRKAVASPWIAVALHTKPGSVAEEMKARRVEVREEIEYDEVTSVKSAGSVSFEVAVQVARAAGGQVKVERKARQVKRKPVPVDEVDVDVFDLFAAG